MKYYGEKHYGMITARLLAEGAQNLSDPELERCLGECVRAKLCINIAKEMRTIGYVLKDGKIQKPA